MKLVTYRHTRETGWTQPLDASLDSPQTLVLLFGAPELNESPGIIAEVAAAFPHSIVTGCSTSGEILGDQIHDHSLVVAVARFEQTEIAFAQSDVSSPADSRAAGRKLAESLTRPALKGILVLSDGLSVNGSELVRGINDQLPAGVTVTGGLAGDGSRFERTWVVRGGKPASGVIVAIGLYGDHVLVGHGSRGGWDKFGPERRVTRSQGNVLFELDGKPALELYKRYLGDRATGLPATGLLFPLALRENAADTKVIVRTLLAVDEANQSMTFAGDIPQDWLCQLMSANFDRLVAGAADAASMTRNAGEADAGNVLSIAISCVGRRLVLGERVEEELEATIDSLPDGTQQVGFYSYGELSPHVDGPCDLQNQTMTLTTICETERKAA